MRHVFPLVLFLLLSTTSQLYALDGTIQVYFDEALTVTTASLEPYEVVTGFIAIDSDSFVDVGAWKGKVQWTDSLQVFMDYMPNGGINLRSFPEFEVGYNIPVQSANDKFLLCTVTILAFGRGELCLAACADEDFPVAVSKSNLGVMYSLDGCSSKADESRIVMREILSQSEYTPAQDITVRSHHAPSGKFGPSYFYEYQDYHKGGLSSLAFGVNLFAAEICFLGTVVDVDQRCIMDDNGTIRSVAITVFQVDVNYWNATVQYIPVVIVVGGNSECIRYDNYPIPDEINIGDEFFIAALYADEVYWPTDDGIAKYDSKVKSISRCNGHLYQFTDALGKVQTYQIWRSYERIQNDSDIVIIADVTDRFFKGSNKSGNIQLQRVISGQKSVIDISTVYANSSYSLDDWLSVKRQPRDYTGFTCALYLTYDIELGVYVLNDSDLSVKVLRRTSYE